uniref:Cytosolic iron-sulfur assembly component 2B n=1 Tax=Varanus komodoensis TaxID=61221 RepID=A0A8D2LDV2_VARKO
MVGPAAAAAAALENANPLVYRRQGERPVTAREEDDELPDAFDDREVFDLIRSINDPEHPLTLEELNVVEQVRVKVNDAESTVSVEFTPTIPHCSMATLIGLSIKVKLIRSLPERFKVSADDQSTGGIKQTCLLIGCTVILQCPPPWQGWKWGTQEQPRTSHGVRCIINLAIEQYRNEMSCLLRGKSTRTET